MYTSRCIKCSIHCAPFCRRQSPRKSSTIARTMVNATHWQMRFDSNRYFSLANGSIRWSIFCCCWGNCSGGIIVLHRETFRQWIRWIRNCFNVRRSIEMHNTHLVNKKTATLVLNVRVYAEWVDVSSDKWRIWHFAALWMDEGRQNGTNRWHKQIGSPVSVCEPFIRFSICTE